MTDATYSRGDYEAGDRVEIEWIFRTDERGRSEREPWATVRVDEPYRETSGHSSTITPAEARELARGLIRFADEAAEFWQQTSPDSRLPEDEN